MKLKLQIVGNGKILYELPLSFTDWPKGQLEDELGLLEDDFTDFSKILIALSNETRFLMMKYLVEKEDHTVNFSDFMRHLDLNPKLVRDNARKLSEGGFVDKIGRGKYRCSEVGESSFIMVSFALRKLIKSFNEF